MKNLPFQRFTQFLASSNTNFQLSNFLDKSGVQGRKTDLMMTHARLFVYRVKELFTRLSRSSEFLLSLFLNCLSLRPAAVRSGPGCDHRPLHQGSHEELAGEDQGFR